MSDEGEEGGGGGSKKIIIIIVAVILLIVVGGAAYFFLFSGDGEEGQEEEEVPVSGAADPLEEPQFLNVGTFVANLVDGRRFLKTNITLMLSEAAAMEY